MAEENAADEIGEIVRDSTMDVHVFDAWQQVIAEDEVDAGGYPWETSDEDPRERLRLRVMETSGYTELDREIEGIGSWHTE